MINEVAALADALAKGGKLPRHEALNKAVKYVLGAPKAKGKEADNMKSVMDCTPCHSGNEHLMNKFKDHP